MAQERGRLTYWSLLCFKEGRVCFSFFHELTKERKSSTIQKPRLIKRSDFIILTQLRLPWSNYRRSALHQYCLGLNLLTVLTHTHSCDGVQMMSAISSSILYHHTAWCHVVFSVRPQADLKMNLNRICVIAQRLKGELVEYDSHCFQHEGTRDTQHDWSKQMNREWIEVGENKLNTRDVCRLTSGRACTGVCTLHTEWRNIHKQTLPHVNKEEINKEIHVRSGFNA